MRVIVTGANGFIGWHLVDALARRGDTVQAWTHGSNGGSWSGPVETAAVDITDNVAVSKQIAAFAPELVIHMAAQSLPGRSWEEPALTYQVNVIGLINLMESIRGLASPARLLAAGSSAEYAEPADGRMIGEDESDRPEQSLCRFQARGRSIGPAVSSPLRSGRRALPSLFYCRTAQAGGCLL